MESITPYTSFCAGGFLYPSSIVQVIFYRHSNIGIVFGGPEGKDVFARSSPCVQSHTTNHIMPEKIHAEYHTRILIQISNS